MHRHYKTRFPGANVSRLHETVSTDTFFSDTAAHDDGIMGHGGTTMLQLYSGNDSRLVDGYPMTSESQMPNTLKDFIIKHGAPDYLLSDNAKVQIGSKAKDILC
jgi:hypothetical protein